MRVIRIPYLPFPQYRSLSGGYFHSAKDAMKHYEVGPEYVWSVQEEHSETGFRWITGPGHHYVDVLGYFVSTHAHDGETYYLEFEEEDPVIVHHGEFNRWYNSDKNNWLVGNLDGVIWHHAISEKKRTIRRRGHRLIRRDVLKELLRAARFYAVMRQYKGAFEFRGCSYLDVNESDIDHAIHQIPLLLASGNKTFKIRE